MTASHRVYGKSSATNLVPKLDAVFRVVDIKNDITSSIENRNQID